MDAGFLADILAHPDDDAVRLIYADHLDEHGEPERAEFIRVQCRLAAWPCECDEVERVYYDECRCKDKAAFQRRQRELLFTNGPHGRRFYWDWLPAIFQEPWFLGRPMDTANVFRRGFIESIALPAADWLTHADAIMAATPLREVTLMDCFPVQHPGDGRYYLVMRNPEPARLREILRLVVGHAQGFDSEQQGRDALSAACLLWASRLVCGIGGTVSSNDGPSLPVSRWRVR